jgi:hypothetical protein
MDIYDTNTLLPVLRIQRPPTTYWLDNFFPNEVTFDTEEIYFDVMLEPRRLAPFVAPNVQGRMMRETGFNTKSFKPAYLKPKHAVTPQRAIPRMAGEAITGTMSLEERRLAIIANCMLLEKNMCMRRWDWMGAQAIINGRVTVVGDDYPSVTVDFGRDPSLDIVLTGTACWNQPTTAAPLADIQSARTIAFNLSRQPITRLTFGTEAWSSFIAVPEILQTLNDFFRGSASTFNTVTTDPGPFEYMGRLAGFGGAGGLDLYRYNDFYEDDSGTTQPYMPANVVTGTGVGIEGFRAFGAVMDADAGLVPVDMFPKMWRNPDPSVDYCMTQSAPLMVPKQPNASFAITVQPS